MIQILINGGWMMIPLLLCSLLGVTIMIERFIYFQKARITDAADRMIKLTQQGKFTDALALAEQRPGPTLRVLASGIVNRSDQPEKVMEGSRSRRGWAHETGTDRVGYHYYSRTTTRFVRNHYRHD